MRFSKFVLMWCEDDVFDSQCFVLKHAGEGFHKHLLSLSCLLAIKVWREGQHYFAMLCPEAVLVRELTF